MGYSICLMKKSNNDSISLHEWLEVIENDKELKLIGSIDGINPLTKQKIRIQIQGHAVWYHPEENSDVEIYYRNGKVCTDYYDDNIIKKMKFLAGKLHAKVLDEFDGEL